VAKACGLVLIRMNKMTKAKTTATQLKGVYNLNPTTMVMKAGSEQARKAVTRARKPLNQTKTKRKSK
jgi:hypothetical protein